jgi:hypothetical protein
MTEQQAIKKKVQSLNSRPFRKNVFNRNEESSYDDTIFDEIDLIPCDQDLESVTPSEIQHAIKKMKTEKAPGKNGLPPEAYKILVGLGEDVLENIITQFWTDQTSTQRFGSMSS